MADSLPWFPLYPTDLMTSTCHLSADAFGAYMRLLCYAWDNHGLPLDDDDRRRIAGIDPAPWPAVWTKIAGKWEERDGRLWNAREEEERAKAITRAQSASAAGKASGRARANGKATDVERTLNGRSNAGSTGGPTPTPTEPQRQRNDPHPHPQPPTTGSKSEPVVPPARPDVPLMVSQITVLEIVDLWNRFVPSAAVDQAKLTADSKRKIAAALHVRSVDDLEAAFARVGKSDYATGRSGQYPPRTLWSALKALDEIEAGGWDDRRPGVPANGLRSVVAPRPGAPVAVVDPNYNGAPYRFHCTHTPTCETWPQHRDCDAESRTA